MNDEAVRARIKERSRAENRPAPRHMVPLERSESLRLLASVPFGRIVFTQRALPAIRPVNHVVADDMIVIRTQDGAALTAAALGDADASGVVVAYEADVIDPETRLGWSVVVTGFAQLVSDPAELARYDALVNPWVAGPMDSTVRIQSELVTGYRLVES